MSYFSEHLRFLTTQTSLAPSAAEGAQEATFCPLLSALFLVWSWAEHAAMPSRAQGCRSWSNSGGFRSQPQAEGPWGFRGQQEHGGPGRTEAAALPQHTSRCFSG